MTDEEANALNLSVAAAMGWTMWGPNEHVWPPPKGQLIQYRDNFKGLPDFCRDVLAFGYLMEWAGQQKCIALRISNDGATWRADCKSSGVNELSFSQFGDTAGEALSRAILAYTEKPK